MYVVHYQHGVGKYEGMVKRTIGGVERDYLLLAYKGGDKLYVPSDQIDTLRQYVGGEAPALHRLGGSRLRQGQEPRPFGRPRDRPGAGRALPEAGQRRGLRVRARHAVAGRDGGRLPLRRDARPAHGDRRREGRHGAGVPDGPPRVRRRRLRQDRGRDPCRVQGDPGRQAGRRARADDAARHAARQHVRRPLRRLPDPGRGAQPLPHTGARPRQVIAGLAIGRGRLRHRHPPAAVGGRQVQGPRPAGRRRGAALRRAAQGGDEAAQDERRRADAQRHADPADARDEPRRHPRPVAAATRRRPTASRSSPTSAATTSGSRSRRSGASCSARARCSGCTTG